MWTTFKATVRTLLLTPSAVVWTLIFPIVLATVFNFMFEPMRSTGSVEAVDVAVVADDAWEDSPFSQVVDTLSEAGEPLLAVHPVAGEKEARDLLAEGSVAGAYVVDAAGESTATPSASAAGAPRIILAPAGSGTSSDASYDINRAILESVATSYLQRVALIEDLAAHDPAALSDPTTVQNALGLGVSVREVSLTNAQPDSMVRFYYALLGMASIFAAQLAGESVWRLQPTSSAAGARRAVSGTSRMRLLIPTIGACWAVSTTFLAIAFGYICLTAHIDFSGREGLCLVGIAASSLLSCGIGALVGALPGRMGSDSRRGILTALTCLLSLFAGLYGEPTMELADTVAHVFPAATWLNPVCLIRDLFYTVYYYDTLVPLYLIIYIGFLSSMGVVLMGEVGGSGAREATEVPRARIALVDRDGSAVAQSLEEMLSQTDELITVADEPLALQDALATGKADAVLAIPAGFGDALMDAARTGGDLPELEAATGGDMQAAALASQRASRTASLIASRAALTPHASAEQVLDGMRKLSDIAPAVDTIETTEESTAASRLAFYLTFSSYTVTSSIVVVAGVVLSTLNKPDVRRRQLAAPVSSWRMGFESIAGCAVLALGVCAWVALVGIGASGAGALLSSAGAQVVLAIASLCAFALVPLSLAYTLAQCGFREEALNAIANLGGMVMSFLGGVWVPLSLMGANVQAVAHFTPTFWMYDAVTCALGAQEVNASVLAAVGIDLGIIALFAVAIVSAGLVAARLRVREV